MKKTILLYLLASLMGVSSYFAYREYQLRQPIAQPGECYSFGDIKESMAGVVIEKLENGVYSGLMCVFMLCQPVEFSIRDFNLAIEDGWKQMDCDTGALLGE